MPGPAVEVWAKLALPGWHRWPDAPEHRDYLAARHRHQFVITAAVAVGHDDRDVEFHDLRDAIESWWVPERGAQSCEHIARALYDGLSSLGMAPTRITVSEDGFDGATLTWA
jgi:hypothetical protein